MILYHVISTYQLLNAMVHAAQREEKADLLVSNWIVDKFPAYQKLEKCFNKVTAYDATYDFWHKKPETAQYIAETVGDLAAYDEVYIWAPQYTLGIYMAENNMPFIFGEDAAGLLTRPKILEDIASKTDPKTFDYNKKLGMYDGTAKSVSKWFCNAKAQAEGFKITDRVIDFDVVREIKALPEDKRREIIGFFVDIEKLPLEKGATLLLTQHFSNLRVLGFDDHALIYQMVIDYFFPNHKLVLKPHPDDLMYYRKLFGDITIIREVNGQREIAVLDLRSKDIFDSPYYYVQQNDVLLVKPSERKINTRSDAAQWYGWGLSGVSIIVAIIAICSA